MTTGTPTTTPAEPKGKLPIDIPTKPDDSGNVNISKSADEIRKERREATTEPTEAKTVEKPKVAETKGEEAVAPPPETVSKEEHQRIVDSIKGGHKGTADKMRQDIAQLNQRIEDLQVSAEEVDITRWLKSAEDGGEDMKVAQSIAERDRASRKAEREAAKLQTTINEKLAILNEAGLRKSAEDFITTYKLGQDNLEELLKAENPTEMENKALKLAREQASAEARPPEAPDKAQASTKGQDLSKMKPERVLGMVMEGELD